MYQYFRNVDDEEVENCLKLLTFLELDEIKELCAHRDERINGAKRKLAYEVVKLIHGEAEADKAMSQAQAAFEGGGVKIDDKKVESFSDALSAYTDGKEFVLAKGKKTKLKVKI